LFLRANAPANRALATQEKLASLGFLCLDHSPYSPDVSPSDYTWSYNKVRELIAVNVLHTSLLNTAVDAFKIRRLGRYAPMPAPSPPFKVILEPVLWNGLKSCRCITPDVISVIKMPSFQYFLCLQKQKKSLVARSGE